MKMSNKWEDKFDELTSYNIANWKTTLLSCEGDEPTDELSKEKIKAFIQKLLNQERVKVLEEIANNNYDKDLKTYDYDGIAEELLSNIKKEIR